jgi:hypothetical protein
MVTGIFSEIKVLEGGMISHRSVRGRINTFPTSDFDCLASDV